MSDAKAALRRTARALRRKAAAAAPDAAERLAEVFLDAIDVRRHRTASGYWPIGEEIDPRPLMARLRAAGSALALPCVEAGEAALRFRAFDGAEALCEGPFGLRQPAASAPELRPTLVIVPLLLFDGAGHRLGYGKGYYDRALAALRSTGFVVAVGVAYAAQRVDALPVLASDQKLDWVVTEEGAEAF